MLQDCPSVFCSLCSWQMQALMSSAPWACPGLQAAIHSSQYTTSWNLWNACEPHCLHTDSENKILLTKDYCTCEDSSGSSLSISMQSEDLEPTSHWALTYIHSSRRMQEKRWLISAFSEACFSLSNEFMFCSCKLRNFGHGTFGVYNGPSYVCSVLIPLLQISKRDCTAKPKHACLSPQRWMYI